MSYQAINWAYDAAVSGTAKSVLVALANFADEEGSCFPSQTRISHMTGTSERTVRRAITHLEAVGLLSKTTRYGGVDGRKSNRYMLHLDVVELDDPEVDEVAPVDDLPDTTTARSDENLPDTLAARSGPTGHSDRHLPANLTGPTGHSDLLTINEPPTEPSELTTLPAALEIPEPPSTFDDFWNVYPRHVAKRTCEAAFAKAVKRAGRASVIVDGARRFAEDPNLPPAQFIPHPSTWLNQDRWGDDPLPARNVPEAGPNRAVQRDIQDLELIRALEQREEVDGGTFSDGTVAEIHSLAARR